MLIVIPVCERELPLAQKLASYIASLGGVQRHQVLVAVAPSCPADRVEAIRATLAPAFASAGILPLEAVLEAGWPRSANSMFSRVVSQIGIPAQPWFFFEVDNTPLAPTWADQIEEEYNLAQKPYLGVVQPAKLRDPQTGEVVKVDGEFVVGSAVYPRDFCRRSTVWRFLDTDEPFDVRLRWEIRPHAHPTKLIAFNWRSVNYTRADDGRIICDPLDSRSITDPIPETAVLLHGCKDGSLIDLLTAAPEEEGKPRKKK